MGARAAPDAGVVDWRRRRLLRAGLGAAFAAELAAQPGTDLHELLLLIDRGCPPELAARIVAPLDAEPSPSAAPSGRTPTRRVSG